MLRQFCSMHRQFFIMYRQFEDGQGSLKYLPRGVQGLPRGYADFFFFFFLGQTSFCGQTSWRTLKTNARNRLRERSTRKIHRAKMATAYRLRERRTLLIHRAIKASWTNVRLDNVPSDIYSLPGLLDSCIS